MKYFFIFLLLIAQHSFSQSTQISGVVINGSDNSKLASASVFINNSTRGTISDNDGKFTITGITETNFELVISYTGFATAVIKITVENINTFQTIKLFPRKTNLAEVKVLSPEKNGWERWGRLFTQSFIGTSDFASACTIENPEVLRFFYDNQTNVLTAYSHGNLIIHNKALGYNIRYQLEEFTYNPIQRSIIYLGYTGFEDLNTKNKHKEKKWEANRKIAYYGSLMHFMRSVYDSDTDAQGFDVKEKIKVYNTDSAFNEIYRQGNIAKTVRIDSNEYITMPAPTNAFKKIPEYIDLICTTPFSFKNLTALDSATHQQKFYFANSLRIIYKNAKEKYEYLQQSLRSLNSRTFQTSEISLLDDEMLLISSNGLYYDPLNLLTSGYWGWCKMAETLPGDYKVESE